MKRKITFVLVSLIFTAFDYSLGMEALTQVYGRAIAGIISSPLFSALYFALVFSVELLSLYALSGAIERILRKRLK